ncbi:MAG: hypothetical protein ACO3AG_03940, partial [Fluviibacter sp.]
DAIWPPQILGLIAAVLGMIIGSLLPQRIGKPTPTPSHHHAAEGTYHVPPTGHESGHQQTHGRHTR